MKFTSSVHDKHRQHHPTRPYTWTLYLGSIQIAESTAVTVGEADAAVDAVIDELAESLRMARRQQVFPGVKL